MDRSCANIDIKWERLYLMPNFQLKSVFQTVAIHEKEKEKNHNTLWAHITGKLADRNERENLRHALQLFYNF